MKRHLSLLLVFPIGLYAACSSKDGGEAAGGGDQADASDVPASGGGPAAPSESDAATAPELAKNPIDGIGAVRVALDTGDYTDGPVWSMKQGVLFFATPLGVGGLYRLHADGGASKVHDGDGVSGAPIGNAVDKAGNIIMVETQRIRRGVAAADAGAPTLVAAGYEDGDGGVGAFDTLKAAVVGASGTIYATDPGYFATPIANRIYRVTPQGNVIVVEKFEDLPRPNGLALTPDGKGLYVGFSEPTLGTKPFVSKYVVNADGSLGARSKFVELDNGAQPDGIEVDQGGNVYIATKAGLAVFKSDATKIGTVAVPSQPTGIAFGGKDLTTLYITTQGTKIYRVTVNVAGIAQ